MLLEQISGTDMAVYIVQSGLHRKTPGQKITQPGEELFMLERTTTTFTA